MDRWARWLLRDRFGGDEAALARVMRELEPVRDRVLDRARIQVGDAVVDVGAGDGLLGFGALERAQPDGVVTFADVSPELLDTARGIADRLGITDRCRFVQTRAEHLDGIPDSRSDVVVLRSVLLYVADKRAAFAAFRRVLRPGGRLSLFEPLNRVASPLNAGSLLGYDARSVRDLAERLQDVYLAAAGGHQGSMMGFGLTDLVLAAEEAGFARIHAEVDVVQRLVPPLGPSDWETLLGTRSNPLGPTLEEAIEEALTSEEATRLREQLEPQVEAGAGRSFTVGCYLSAELG